MPDGYQFQHKKVGTIVVANPVVLRYKKKEMRLIVDLARKVYFCGEILGHPNKLLSSVQSGPERSIRLPDDFAPSGCLTTPDRDTLWVLLEAPGINFFGHWIVDHFPRLYLLYKQGLIDRVKFVFFDQPPKWADIFFEIFSISKSRIVVVEDNCVRADVLIIPAFFRERKHLYIEYTAEAWQFLQQKLREKRSNESFKTTFFHRNRHLKKVQKNIGKKNLRVYISREKSKCFMEKENELKRLLVRHGFFVFFPEEVDLPTTAAFLEHADMVVGEDGSGMHNVVFCRRSCDVIVIGSRTLTKSSQQRENRYQRVINANLFDRSWFYTPRLEAGKAILDIENFENFFNGIIDAS
ncbi:MAG: glycosyltransferase family 61 protein [Deltaproteobacteria bacterium]|nr:glycosyltransferase family 61 protein [Deltaproteobacteria bacterium]